MDVHCNHSCTHKANHSYTHTCNDSYMSTQLANRIKEIRISSGDKPQEAANKIGVSRQAFMKWENGATENMKLGNLLAFCEKYKVSVENLLRENEAPYSPYREPGKNRHFVSEHHIDAENLFILPDRRSADSPLIKEVSDIMEMLDTGRQNRLAERARVLLEEQRAEPKANTAS